MYEKRSANEKRKLNSKEEGGTTGLNGSVVPRVPVVLLESTSVFREGLIGILRGSRFEVIEAAASIAAVSPTPAHAPELVLIGPGADAAATACQIEACRQRFPSARLITLNDRFDGHSLVRMLETGVSAYLGRAVTTEVLLLSLELVTLGAMVFSAPSPCVPAAFPKRNDLNGHPMQLVKIDQLAERDDAHRLSPREFKILHCLVQGEPNKLIARKLQITEATVKVHIKSILRKIRASNRTQAAIWAMSHLPQDQTPLTSEPLKRVPPPRTSIPELRSSPPNPSGSVKSQ